MSLLYRQKSFAYLEKPAEWEALVNSANEWLAKANQSGSAAPPAAAPPPPPSPPDPTVNAAAR